MKDKIFKRSVWTLLTVFFALFFSIVLVADGIAADYSPWIDRYFDAERYKLVEKGEASDEDTQYVKSEFAVKDENGNIKTELSDGVKKQVLDDVKLREKSLAVAEQANEEGSVLLWNKTAKDGKPALPLEKNAKVSNFGVGTVVWFYSGLGSGYVNLEDKAPNLQTSLASRGMEVNPTMIKTLENGKRLGYSVGLGLTREMPWDVYNQRTSGGVEKAVENYSDAAILTISRWCGEGHDMQHQNFSDDGDTALTITNAECSLMEGLVGLKESGKIKKIILLIDSANPLPMEQILKYDIDACLWVGWGGNTATDAVADLLVGNANPSGRLTDTWIKDLFSSPANRNYGNFVYTEYEGVPPLNTGSNNNYVVYQEGIYVGYRYYETRYEDCVLGTGNANAATGVLAGDGSKGWSYGDEMAFTFGHGESYTSFRYDNFSVRKSGGNYDVSVSVTNTGSTAGKEVVQVYLQKPYTDYDKQKGIEKSAVELVGFDKTELLEPGGSETVTITVPEYEFKTYDSYGEGTYILEKGSYYLATGKNAHDALNNILAAKNKTKADGMDADGNKSFAHKIDIDKDDFETYAVSPFTGEEIKNRFDDTDPTLYAETKNQGVKFLSRSDWGKTYPSDSGVTLTCTSVMANTLSYDMDVPNNPEDEMPLYETVTSEYGKLNLIQLMGLPYEHKLWDDILNQMTFTEQAQFTYRVVKGCTSINAPGADSNDGPCGLTAGILGPNLETKMGFPCNPILASTFNVELIEEVGVAFGNEMMLGGRQGLFGVGANIHRSAFCGRVWEYYSEDGFLSGKMNSAESKGLRRMGIILFTKHFALNDQETNRQGVMTWANEQTIREIYLKAFETAITDGYTNGLMTSFNRFGCTWSGLHKGLLTDLLRGEWGFSGVTLTDAGGTNTEYMGSPNNSINACAVIAGQNAWLSNATGKSLTEYYEAKNATVCKAVREATHRSLYVMLNSAAMNGMSSTTEVLYVKPAWEKLLLAAEIITGILALACLSMVAVSWVLWYRDKRDNA